MPYGYGSLRAPAPRKSNNALLAGVLVALWLSSLVLSVAYIRYIGRSPFAADRTAATAPLVIAPESDTQEQKVAASVDHLTKALVKSFERMNRLDAAVQKSKRDLQKIAARVTTDQTVARISVPQTLETETKAPGAAVETSIPKNWHRVLNIKPTDAATPHKNNDGTVDYWFVPRGGEELPSRVLPIGTSADGVVVHNLEDGKDYTLTPGGEWKNGALATASSGN